MGRIGMPEVIIILGVFILLFGAKKIPEIASALGRAVREFKKSSQEVEEQVTKTLNDDQSQKKS